ncbi:hypothetical protein NDU88_000434 [Pleurodeles waltl]|uniref:Uncharacterized protein n=1 Tax=Pleurodeles waltl TaxID=8319 RepID=A0AAV7N9H9_PLEWA|nr:hypothetical protein NDU88_000434 [Pleurodeles waltl]
MIMTRHHCHKLLKTKVNYKDKKVVTDTKLNYIFKYRRMVETLISSVQRRRACRNDSAIYHRQWLRRSWTRDDDSRRSSILIMAAQTMLDCTALQAANAPPLRQWPGSQVTLVVTVHYGRTQQSMLQAVAGCATDKTESLGLRSSPSPGSVEASVPQVPSSFQGRAVVSTSNAPRLNKKVLVRSWAVEVVTGTRPPHTADTWAQD